MAFEVNISIDAAIGGTAEALGGGKPVRPGRGGFANGAVTGAYVMMFNHLMHNDREKFQATDDDPPKKAEENSKQKEDSKNPQTDDKDNTSSKKLMYNGEPVFGENNGGRENWSGGGQYAQFGTSPYAIGTRGANTDWTPNGLQLLFNSWAATIAVITIWVPIPKGANAALWTYNSYTIVDKTTTNYE